DEALLAFGESMFANANRFIRADMALEAALDDADALPQRDAVLAFAARVDATRRRRRNACATPSARSPSGSTRRNPMPARATSPAPSRTRATASPTAS